jgi:large repetitive protein
MNKLLKLFGALTLALLSLTSTIKAGVPAAPGNLLPGWLFGDIILTWDEVPSAASYQVYKYDAASASWTTVATGLTVPYYRETNVPDPTQYTVSAINAEGESTPAAPVTTQQTGDGFSMAFSSENRSFYETKTILSWGVSLVAGADAVLEVGTSPTNLVYVGRDTNYATFHQFTVTNLLPETAYIARITCVGSNRTGVTGWIQFNTLATNRPPTVFDTTLSIYEDPSTPVQFWVSAFDPEGPNLTLSVASGPSHGTLTPADHPFYRYVPDPNWFGTETITFVASDGERVSAPGTITIQVLPVNDAPVASPASAVTGENLPVEIPLQAFDVEGDPVSFRIYSSPSNGVAEAVGMKATYYPKDGFVGTETFRVVPDDGVLYGQIVSVTVTVTNVNHAPRPANLSISTREGTLYYGSFLVSDEDGDVITCEIVDGPTNGTVSVTGTNFVYTPKPGANFTDSFTYRATDGSGTSPVASITLEIIGNSPPVAASQSLTVLEDGSANLSLWGSDPDGDPVSAVLLTSPAHGNVSGTHPNYLYQPDPNFNGTDSFTFTVNDGFTNGNVATVSITITPLIDSPVRVSPDRGFAIPEDGYVDFDMQATDVDGDTLTYTIVTPPAHGTVTRQSANTWTYRPASNWFGMDQLTWVASDGKSDCALGTVQFQVSPVNDRPLAGYQSVTNAEDQPIALTLYGEDAEAASLSYSIVTPPSHGTLSGSGSNVVYTPAPNYVGQDSFVFKVNDGSLDSLPATVTVTLTEVNDAPVADTNALTAFVTEDRARQITLWASDADGDVLTYTIIHPPGHGTISGSGSSVTYTPATNYNGPDSFSWKASDGNADSAVATINVSVAAVNDVPVSSNQILTIEEDTPLNLTLLTYDGDGDALTYVITSGPTKGTFNGTAPNLVYTPNPNFVGSDTITFYARDGVTNGNAVSIFLNITPVNDAPVANSQTVSTAYNTPWNITLTGADVEGNPLTFAIVGNPANGSLTGVAPNITFSPNVGWSGTTTLSFKVSDGTLNSSVATVTITVAPPSSIPPAPSGLTTTVASSTQINLAWNDTATNEDGFKIERSTDNRTFTEIGTVGPNVRSFSSSGLASNKTYYFRIRAFNKLGNSGYSSTASARTSK